MEVSLTLTLSPLTGVNTKSLLVCMPCEMLFRKNSYVGARPGLVGVALTVTCVLAHTVVVFANIPITTLAGPISFTVISICGLTAVGLPEIHSELETMLQVMASPFSA